MLRRLLDVAIATGVLVISAPAVALAAVAIKLESNGPVLFSQVRVGRNRAPIRTLKLRTMVVGADRVGAQVTAGADSRVTRVGRFLRRTKVDELPQLWNVIRGDMSIVGPRPEVPRYVEIYRSEWEQLFSVRPGLTDLASLTFRDEESLLALADDHERAYREVVMPMKLELALDGVSRSSLRYDLGIILRTLMSVAFVRTSEQTQILDQVAQRIEQLNRATR